MSKFKEIDFEKRKKECQRIMSKHKDRIPIIVELNTDREIKLDKNKYLVPHDLTISQFMFVLRRRMKLKESEAIFCYCDKTLPPSSAIINDIYEKYKGTDGYLYITVAFENSFG